jgi:hypothetical protein
MKRDSSKRRRGDRSEEKKKTDNAAVKKWREENKEYVTAYDHLRHAERVDNYTPAQVEEARLKGRNDWHLRSAKAFEANPVKGVRAPKTGLEVQKACAVLTTPPPEIGIGATDSGLHIIMCARKSWRAKNGEDVELENGNQLMIPKFIKDFVNPIQALTAESVVWHGRGADDALPWVARGADDDDLPLPLLDANLWNENADRRFSTFFADVREYSTVVVVVRGIDGASTNVDSWIGLATRYPKLNIILAFTVAEVYIRFRGPANLDFCYRTEPYDERLYCFFPLAEMIKHVTGVAPLPKYAWLLSEWRTATVWRQAISIAYQSGDQNRIDQIIASYSTQRFRPRNGLPLFRNV